MYVISLFVITILCFSCNSSKLQKIENKQVINKLEKQKNLELIADSSFLDFFGKFMWDKEFQKQRVHYPFNLKGFKILRSEDWKHLPFYSQLEYIPTFTSDTLSIYEKEVKQDKIELFMLNFDKFQAESFFFEKINKNWFLINAKIKSINNIPDHEFIDFMIRFSKDSVFQVNHISFPLKESFLDSENDYETINNTIKQNDWKFWNLTESLNNVMFFSTIQVNNNYRNVFFRGNENGIWVKYTFEKVNSSWLLVRLEDYST
jgi:hypothetical protein